MTNREFLFELGTEELPPRTLLALSSALEEGLVKGLETAGIPHGKAHAFATPRRLAVRIERVAESAPDRKVERRGPPVEQFLRRPGQPHAGGDGLRQELRRRGERA
jgi:glycyl-tRNA synthetase beta chain